MKELTRNMMLDMIQMKAFSEDPFIVSGGHGVRITDVNGKEYIDGLAGVFVVNVGYGNSAVIEAMTEQMYRLSFAPPLHGTNPPAVQLASLLVEIAPKGTAATKLLSGGSEATESAMKMARQYHVQTGNPRKYKIISRYLAYHGATFGSMSASGVAAIKSMFEPAVEGFIHVAPPYCYRCPYENSYPACNMVCARMIERTIRWEGPDTVAAVIVDPIMVSGGLLVPPREYFKLLREICDRHNVLLIFDEVICGFGRLGKLFAADFYDVTPDIIAAGKGISSGYAPMGAILIQEKVAKAFWGDPDENLEFHHGHTFGGNPLSAAASIANIRQMLDGKMVENAAEVGAYLGSRLETLYEYPVVGDVRGEGLLWGIEFVKDRETKEPFDASVKPGKRIEKLAKQRGAIFRAGFDFIALSPPLCITKSELDELFEILRSSIADVSKELIG